MSKENMNNENMNNENISNNMGNDIKQKRRKKKKMSTGKKVLLIVLAVFLVIVGVATGYGYSILNKMQHTKLSSNNEDLGIDENILNKLKDTKDSGDIVSIAFLGIDRADKTDVGRSDATMVVSIDFNRKKIKLTSIMRDSHVVIPGRDGRDKLNHAYEIGGPQLTLKTINQNFGLNVKEFAAVRFEDLEQIIDALGGVDIDVKSNEIQYINGYQQSLVDMDGKGKVYTVTSPGMQTLNGPQATAYCRIRYLGNGDFDRTERQRKVLTSLINKLMKTTPAKAPAIANKLLPFVNTSFTPTEAISLGTKMLTAGGMTIEQERFPLDGYCWPNTKGAWYLEYDESATREQIYDYIYKDIKPVPKEPKF